MTGSTFPCGHERAGRIDALVALFAVSNFRRTRGMADDQLFPELRSADSNHFPNQSHDGAMQHD